MVDKLGAPGLTGPVVYCPVCLNETGIYKPKKGSAAVPIPGGRCRGCSKRAEDRKAKFPAKGSSKSVRAVSGGLPSLGKGRK
jgi:hypothetical protein